MKCKVCTNNTSVLFRAKVLNKYDVIYYQCNSCNFIQPENPYWLEESYNKVITSLDIGLISRNNNLSDVATPLIYKYFGPDKKYLDYGGGYGLFVRLMRDKGLNFYRQDLYCENLFANYFDIEDLQLDNKFELLTAFEVFEHLVNPIEEIEKMFTYAPSILFSTTLQPNQKFNSVNDWWYFIPETGQHVALYSYKTLKEIAQKFDKNLYSNTTTLHLLTDKDLPQSIFNKSFLVKIMSRLTFKKYPSLLESDFKKIKNILNTNNAN